MCLRAIKTKHYSCSAYLSNVIAQYPGYNIDLYFKQALQFPKPKTKGRHIWPPPRAAKGPAIYATGWNQLADRFISSASSRPFVFRPARASSRLARARLFSVDSPRRRGRCKFRTRKRRTWKWSTKCKDMNTRDLLGLRRAFVASARLNGQWLFERFRRNTVVVFNEYTLLLRTFVLMDNLRAFRYSA